MFSGYLFFIKVRPGVRTLLVIAIIYIGVEDADGRPYLTDPGLRGAQGCRGNTAIFWETVDFTFAFIKVVTAVTTLLTIGTQAPMVLTY